MAADRGPRDINMNEQSANIRVETRALKRSITAALGRQRRSYNGTEPVALLMLQPISDELPSALIEDGDLAPVDKVIWLVLMSRACDADGVTVLPTHLELAKRTNVAATDTVARALAILRCRRWLSVCHTSWRKGGQRKGSAYALHAKPLPIVDTIYLDPHYRTFLEGLSGQRHSRVRKAACDVLAQLSH